MKKILSAMSFMALFCLITFSNASATGILASEWGMGDFNKIVQVSAFDVFANPGMSLDAHYTEQHATALGSIFDADIFNDWTVITDVSGKEVTAQGSALDVLAWFYNFNMNYEWVPFSFEFYGYLDSQLIDWTTITYDGGSHGAGPHGSPLNNGENFSFVMHNITNPVPEPATMWLLGFGLLGIAGLRRKIKK